MALLMASACSSSPSVQVSERQVNRLKSSIERVPDLTALTHGDRVSET